MFAVLRGALRRVAAGAGAGAGRRQNVTVAEHFREIEAQARDEKEKHKGEEAEGCKGDGEKCRKEDAAKPRRAEQTALVFNPKVKEFKLEKIPVPFIHDDEVLVRVGLSGVCGSDLRLLAGDGPAPEHRVVPGREVVGTVERVGSSVRHLHPGDPVAVDPYCGCGHCRYCEQFFSGSTMGESENGGWQHFCARPARQVFRLPKDMDPRAAVLAHQLSCVLHGVDLVQPLPYTDTVVVQGAGMMGLLWACVLHRKGVGHIVVSEPDGRRREVVERLALKGCELTSPQDLHLMALRGGWKASLIVDCSGSTDALQHATDLLHVGGKLCLAGEPSSDATIKFNLPTLFSRELKVMAARRNAYGFEPALQLLADMESFDLEKLGVRTWVLQDYHKAMRAIDKGEVSKAILDIGKK